MSERLSEVFQCMDTAGVRYLLLRPVSSTIGFNDVDLLVLETDFTLLFSALEDDGFKPEKKRMNASRSIKIVIDETILDIQFSISFLAYRSLVIKELPPFASIRKVGDTYIPDTDDAVLFTFWTYRLILDKTGLRKSGSFQIYKKLFAGSWEELIKEEFFLRWTSLIFGEENRRLVMSEMIRILKNDWRPFTLEVQGSLRKRAIDAHPGLEMKILLDKLKFKTLRRLGYYN